MGELPLELTRSRYFHAPGGWLLSTFFERRAGDIGQQLPTKKAAHNTPGVFTQPKQRRMLIMIAAVTKVYYSMPESESLMGTDHVLSLAIFLSQFIVEQYGVL